ncbi:HNH endonuclease [Hoeflea sp. TYP-13]|uniref:HNH endonuclease n=1 Tax=Hoeflea sp. TYP-13 TaxID=3230023 RepID=UPI0034C624C8
MSPAEDKIVEAVARYVGLQKRVGETANRTFQMIANRGLIEAAEVSVMRNKPTQGFEVLEEADLEELSFEKIIFDHPDEFSPRAIWYARQTLGEPNESDMPPASQSLITQIRTDKLIGWWREMIAARGQIGGYSNTDVGEFFGFHDLSSYGRVLGNITSRIDFACYKCGLPPLGLCAETPFARAWRQEDRRWAFPQDQMAAASKSRNWTAADLDAIQIATRELPGTASIPWRNELREAEALVRDWAFSLKGSARKPQIQQELAADLDEMRQAEKDALGQTPKAKKRISQSIERGNIGALVKKRNGFKCQVCEALGNDPYPFKKKNGVPYVEAHHVIPVSELQIGTLSATNIMTLCANHHRQFHYGVASVTIESDHFDVSLDGQQLRLERCSIATD